MQYELLDIARHKRSVDIARHTRRMERENVLTVMLGIVVKELLRVADSFTACARKEWRT